MTPAKLFFFWTTITSFLCASGASQAQSINLVNPSFEIPAGGQGSVPGVPYGWAAANKNPYGVYNPAPGLFANEVNDVLPSPAQGSQVLWINAGNYLAQFLTNTLIAGQTYTLSGAIGNRGDAYGLVSSDQDYVVLLAGNTTIAQNANLPHPAPGYFLPWSISYTAPAAGFPTGALQIQLGQNGTGEVIYDNISLTASPAGAGVLTPTITSITSSGSPAIAGNLVTFTATVSGSGGVPAGTVTFFDGGAELGSVALNNSGQALFSTSTLSTGGSPHSITAVYGGSSVFSGSTSSALSQVITSAVTVSPTTTTVASSQNPAAAGSTVTFTATVSSGDGIPAGAVTFYNLNTVLDAAALNGSGQAAYSTSSLLASGSPYAITAVYSGNSAFAGSASSALSQIITNATVNYTNASGPLWALSQRMAYSAVPVPSFRPTVANSVIALDEMPNGAPADAGNGLVWQDWCLEDCFANDSSIVHALHVATHPSFMEISSQVYNGANPLPLLIGQGNGNTSSSTWVVAISNNVFYILSGIGGVTDGSAARPGAVGEYVSSSLPETSQIILSSGATANVAAINLTPGDWDVDGVVHFDIVGGTVTSSSAATSIYSNANPPDGTAVASGIQLVGASTYNSIPIPRKQINISSPTTVYLVGTCYFSAGNVYTFGQITARRMR